MTGQDDRLAFVVEQILLEAAQLHEQTARQSSQAIAGLVQSLRAALAGGAKVLIFGNGGSAADAQHFACELVGRFMRDRRALPAVALTTDTSILTAIANDFGFDQVFARQVEALGRPGDVAIGISTSGRSANVVMGLQAAKARGLMTVALTGNSGGEVAGAADLHVAVAHSATPRIQEAHRTIIHAVCDLVERDL
jgi:D-sedoheptulose 7-phosphate isomerase